MAIKVEPMTYEVDGVTMCSTYYVDEDLKEKRPGILVFADARGLDDVTHAGARRLAEQGYPALACDVYGGGRYIENLEEAVALATQLVAEPDLTRGRGIAGIDALTAHAEVDADRIGAVGYCFGGNVAVEVARGGVPLAASVGFHGGAVPPMPARSKNISGKILLCLGAEDPMIPLEMRTAFEEDMRAADVDFRMHLYGRVYHSFTRPNAHLLNKPNASRYDAGAEARSWKEMMALFDEVFA